MRTLLFSVTYRGCRTSTGTCEAFYRRSDASNVQVALRKGDFYVSLPQCLGDGDRYVTLKLKPSVLPSAPEPQFEIQCVFTKSDEEGLGGAFEQDARM